MEQGDALNSKTADGYSNADDRDIQLVALKRIVTYRKYYTEAQFSDKIQTEALGVFLLAINNHLYSFALRFLFLQTHTTSYVFLQVTYCTL